MKLKITTTILCMVIILVAGYFNQASTHTSGAPANVCGSVANASTCTSCHAGGSNAIQPGWITSTIPASGYIPGTTYTITATAASTGRSKFGFEISPQNNAGALLGTMIVTNVAQTKLISAGKFITHTTGGTSGPNSKAWMFDWTAPSVGTGDVTFYGAFLCANSSNSSSGDLTFKANLTSHEDITTSIGGNMTEQSKALVYPNPVIDYFRVNYKVDRQGFVEIKMVDLQGQTVAALLSEIKAAGYYRDFFKIPFNLDSGVYFLEIATETGTTVTKMLVQQ